MTATKTTQVARVAGRNGFSLISDDKFREIYSALLQSRMLGELLRPDSVYERWAGVEARTAAVVACLRAGDSVTATPRGVLASYLLNNALPSSGKTSHHPTRQLAAATGNALRHKLEKLGNVSVVFAAIGNGDQTREVFAAAAGYSLPVLYVLDSSAELGPASGNVPIIRVDAADAVAIYRVAHESIQRARKGGGPTIMECAPWPGDEVPPDPLAKLERYLAGKKIFSQSWKRRLEEKHRKAREGTLKRATQNG